MKYEVPSMVSSQLSVVSIQLSVAEPSEEQRSSIKAKLEKNMM